MSSLALVDYSDSSSSEEEEEECERERNVGRNDGASPPPKKKACLDPLPGPRDLDPLPLPSAILEMFSHGNGINKG